MKFGEALEAFNDAKNTMSSLNVIADGMAAMLVGRLRHANACDVARLKRELRDFNLKTFQWKKR